MVYVKAAKDKIHRELTQLVKQEPQDMVKFIAKQAIQTGLKNETISEVIHNMYILDLIEIRDDVIYKKES